MEGELGRTDQLQAGLDTLGPALGLPGAHLDQDVFGLKLRLAGDVLYTPYPQVSLGVQYKRQREEVETRNEADGAVYRSEKMLKDNKDTISEGDKKKIEDAGGTAGELLLFVVDVALRRLRF